MVIRHIGRYIRLVMCQINRFWLCVIRREVTVVIRRNPHGVRRMSVHIPYERTLDKHRPYNITRSIKPAVSYYLHIQSRRTVFSNQRCYILEDRRSETSLNQQGVVIPSMGFYNSQIINPSVPIEVEVVNHIAAGIKQALKFLHATRFRKSSSNSIEVQIERQIVVEVCYGNGSNRSHFGCRRS
jgi:hypothetical protein